MLPQENLENLVLLRLNTGSEDKKSTCAGTTHDGVQPPRPYTLPGPRNRSTAEVGGGA